MQNVCIGTALKVALNYLVHAIKVIFIIKLVLLNNIDF